MSVAHGIEIRGALESDIPLLLQLIRELAEYERLLHDVRATVESLRETLFGPKRYAETLLAFFDGEPAGFAVYFFTYSTFAAKPVLYLEDLFVRPALRGKGIGKCLFTTVMQAAAEEGCARMDWSVLDWNSSAIDFYEKLGARAYREWLKYSLPA